MNDKTMKNKVMAGLLAATKGNDPRRGLRAGSSSGVSGNSTKRRQEQFVLVRVTSWIVVYVGLCSNWTLRTIITAVCCLLLAFSGGFNLNSAARNIDERTAPGGHTQGRTKESQSVTESIKRVENGLPSSYVGQYELAPNFILTISAEKDRLFVQATGQSKLELFPESETKFFPISVAVEITFVKDEKGQVTHLILRQVGQDITAKKIK